MERVFQSIMELWWTQLEEWVAKIGITCGGEAGGNVQHRGDGWDGFEGWGCQGKGQDAWCHQSKHSLPPSSPTAHPAHGVLWAGISLCPSCVSFLLPCQQGTVRSRIGLGSVQAQLSNKIPLWFHGDSGEERGIRILLGEEIFSSTPLCTGNGEEEEVLSGFPGHSLMFYTTKYRRTSCPACSIRHIFCFTLEHVFLNFWARALVKGTYTSQE